MCSWRQSLLGSNGTYLMKIGFLEPGISNCVGLGGGIKSPSET